MNYTRLLKMASGSIPLAEVIRRCVRGGSDDENSDESEDDISDMSEESEEDLDCEEQEAGETSQSNSEAREGNYMFVSLCKLIISKRFLLFLSEYDFFEAFQKLYPLYFVYLQWKMTFQDPEVL